MNEPKVVLVVTPQGEFRVVRVDEWGNQLLLDSGYELQLTLQGAALNFGRAIALRLEPAP